MASMNRTLGKFDLIGIPSAPRGVPQIEVTFDIDANGIVHVSAKDLGTGKEQKIRIESSSGLSDSEIEKMVKDAEMHASEDKLERERIEARNEADNLIYSTDKSLKEFGDKISDEDKAAIEQAKEELNAVLGSDDIESIKSKTEALQQVAYKLAEEVYKQSAGQQPSAEGTGGAENVGGSGDAGAEEQAQQESADKDNVEDADYEVVDD